MCDCCQEDESVKHVTHTHTPMCVCQGANCGDGAMGGSKEQKRSLLPATNEEEGSGTNCMWRYVDTCVHLGINQ